MNWLSAVPIIGGLFDSIGTAIDKNVTTDEERLKLRAEMMALAGPVIQSLVQAQGKFDEMKLQLQLAEVQSGDKFVRWTRPLMTWLTFTFWAYTVVFNHPAQEMAFYAFGLIGGLFSATRGAEKMVGKWSNGRNGNTH